MGKRNEQIFHQRRYMKNTQHHSLVIRKRQIKTTMRCHFIPTRMATINKTVINRCLQRCRETGTLIYCWWKCKIVPSFGKLWQFLKKCHTAHKNINCHTTNIKLSHNPSILLLSMYSREMKTHIHNKDLHMNVHSSSKLKIT